MMPPEEMDALITALVDAIESVPPDLIHRWKITVDGVRGVDGDWIEYRGQGPSLTYALTALAKNLRGVP